MEPDVPSVASPAPVAPPQVVPVAVPAAVPAQPRPQRRPTRPAVAPAQVPQVAQVTEAAPADTGAGAGYQYQFPLVIVAAAQRLLDLIADDECSEVLMNGPNEISKKVRGVRYHCSDIAFGDASTYHRVINEFVLRYCDTHERIDGRTAILEGQLELPSPSVNRPPMLARCHIIAPPGVPFAKVTIAKKPRYDLSLDDLAANGSMSADEAEFLKAVARGRLTTVVSGPTGSGKTTLLQALTHYYDPNDRVVVVEEIPELRLPQGDVVYLRATMDRPGLDPSEIYSLDLWVRQANRMRMDRIIVGETRGAEMESWLLAANSGAEGSATTVHANNSRRALDKILALATKSPTATSEAQLLKEIAASIDIVVQTSLIDGQHLVTEIQEITPTVTRETGLIQTVPLFEYDPLTKMHMPRTRPSEALFARLANRGVMVNSAWFQRK